MKKSENKNREKDNDTMLDVHLKVNVNKENLKKHKKTFKTIGLVVLMACFVYVISHVTIETNYSMSSYAFQKDLDYIDEVLDEIIEKDNVIFADIKKLNSVKNNYDLIECLEAGYNLQEIDLIISMSTLINSLQRGDNKENKNVKAIKKWKKRVNKTVVLWN